MSRAMNILVAVSFLGLAYGLDKNDKQIKKLEIALKAQEEHSEYLTLLANCLQRKAALNRTDAYLAAYGKTRSMLPKSYAPYFPMRNMYDTQDSECKKYAEYMEKVLK